MQTNLAELDKEAYELALRGLAVLESQDADQLFIAREAILDFLPQLSDPALDDWAIGLTRVASKIQEVRETVLAPQYGQGVLFFG